MALKGFFDLPSTTKKKVNPSIERYSIPGEPDCANCGLDKLGCKSPKIPPTGEGKRKILGLSEGPGEDEDTLNKNYVGEAGKDLANKLAIHGLDLHRDFVLINSVNCRPPKNRKPTSNEILCCRPFVLKTIKEFNPEHIWLFGGSALESYLGNRFTHKTIGRWADICFPDPNTNAWVTSLYHPSYIIRNPKDEFLKFIDKKYIQNAVKRLDRNPPSFIDIKSEVTILNDHKKVIFHLNRILKTEPLITIDYETTGLKPYKIGHKIYCVSIDDGERSYVFPLQRPGFWSNDDLESILKNLREILSREKILKNAHNRNFEDTWSKEILGVEVKGWDWCTMTTAHLIDTRKFYSGLKFQSFIHFGVEGYEEEIKPYLENKSKEDEFNTIQNAPIDKLHLYCGMDTVCSRRLREVQKAEIAKIEKLEEARKFTMEGLEALAEVQHEGILCNKAYFENQYAQLQKRIERQERIISESEAAEFFRKSTGKQFNYNSDKDLRHLLFDLLQFDAVKETKGGKASVDQEVLLKIDHPIVENILTLRKYDKIRNTYLSQYLREITEKNKIHPIQNLHIAATHRSSQDHPNFQNIPVREEAAKLICRSGIIAPQIGNFRLCEADYGSQEVRIIACYSEDRKLIDYILDPTTDMHRDEASSLFMLPKERVSKQLRFFSKNGWVFPQFYRSYYKSCAHNLWKEVIMPNLPTEDGVPIQEHFKSKRIFHSGDFENHCKKLEDSFWRRYQGVRKWQDKIIDSYLRKGYVSSFFGHIRTGFLTPNEIVNTPIQGTAFHCLLWTLKEAIKWIKEEKLNSKIINQIHDSVKSYLQVEEQTYFLHKLKKIAEEEIRDKFKWLIIPLQLDIEMTPIGGNWYQKEEVQYMTDGGLFEGMWVSLNKDGTVKHVYDNLF